MQCHKRPTEIQGHSRSLQGDKSQRETQVLFLDATFQLPPPDLCRWERLGQAEAEEEGVVIISCWGLAQSGFPPTQGPGQQPVCLRVRKYSTPPFHGYLSPLKRQGTVSDGSPQPLTPGRGSQALSLVISVQGRTECI